MWSVDRLDELIAYFDEGYETHHDEAYRRFASVMLDPPSDLPEDPFSSAYRQRYLDLYKAISAKPEYTVQNERAEFDVDNAVHRPFPYYTQSLTLTSLHFSLMGKLFNMMQDLKPGSRILECGFGWGNTTLALAALGYKVTALDIEPRYCELVAKRADIARVDVELVHSDFLWVEQADHQFDAVVFFESFHHCWEFERLLTSLHRVMAPGGKIYFGAEPINDDFKVPWGVRLDGESLFVARTSGWMELGFRRAFFAELLKRTGWRGKEVEPHFWVASRLSDPIRLDGNDSRLHSQTGQRENGLIRVDSPGPSYALYGPYIDLDAARYRAAIELAGVEPFEGDAVMDVCVDGVPLAANQLSAAECMSGRIECEFELGEPGVRIEVRLLVPEGFKGAIEGVAFTYLD